MSPASVIRPPHVQNGNDEDDFLEDEDFEDEEDEAREDEEEDENDENGDEETWYVVT